ncbi:hypothetical protein VKT23_017781 [Stygiomarasmius scandens]|uniref:Uncharacterized protein n=1 Tax=Marasmiellus scandens TaxID=2682957 RepID=A0ABR1IQT0_9AGAR
MDDIEHHLTHWIKQGADYIQRKKGWDNFESSKFKFVRELNVWEQPEAQKLEEMYGINGTEETSYTGPDLGAEEYHEIKEKCYELEFDVSNQNMSKRGVNEEQEREMSNEAEQQRETERPPPMEPAGYKISDDL